MFIFNYSVFHTSCLPWEITNFLFVPVHVYPISAIIVTHLPMARAPFPGPLRHKILRDQIQTRNLRLTCANGYERL